MPEPIQQEPQKEKIVVEFMHTDELGNPIIDPRTGKQGFTNLTAETQEEMVGKMKEAYINVNRALARARTHRAVPKAENPPPKELSIEEERQAAADLADPTKARQAIRKLAGVDSIEEQNRKIKEAQDTLAANKAAYQFMSAHLNDYYPCAANSAVMSEEINAQHLDPTVADNYEIAFNAVQHRLAQRPAPHAAQPTPEPEPRRQAAGGIEPGTLTGARPMQRAKKKEIVTKQEIADMRKTPEGRAEFNRRLRMEPEFGPAVDALFAKT